MSSSTHIFKTIPTLIRSAKSLLTSVSNIQKRSPTVTSEAIPLSRSPYMVHLAAAAAAKEGESRYSEDAFLSAIDLLDAVLETICLREESKVGVRSETQIRVLLGLSLLYAEDFTYDQITQVLELYSIDRAHFSAMQSHRLLRDFGLRKGFQFGGLSDYLRAKGLCRWLFEADESMVGIEGYLANVVTESMTSLDIFAEIAPFYMRHGEIANYLQKDHAQKAINMLGFQFAIVLFAKYLRREFKSNSHEIGRAVLSGLLHSKPIQNQRFSGELTAIDLSGWTFEQCRFEDFRFRDCSFDAATTFAGCSFEGELEFFGCSGVDRVVLSSDCKLSSSANAAFSSQQVKGARNRVSEADLVDLLRYVFMRFQSGTSYVDISEEGLRSMAQKRNPVVARRVIDELIKQKVISTHE